MFVRSLLLESRDLRSILNDRVHAVNRFGFDIYFRFYVEFCFEMRVDQNQTMRRRKKKGGGEREGGGGEGGEGEEGEGEEEGERRETITFNPTFRFTSSLPSSPEDTETNLLGAEERRG
jgi:hypothetical protein